MRPQGFSRVREIRITLDSYLWLGVLAALVATT